MSYSANLPHIIGEWIGEAHLVKYFLQGITWLVLALLAFPLWIAFLIYVSIFVVLIYDKTFTLKGDNLMGCRLVLAYIWDVFGRIWYGYEVHGMEKIRKEQTLFVNYHGALPTDHLLFIARVLIKKQIQIGTVTDLFVFKFPGIKKLLEVLCMITGSKEECIRTLKDGYSLSISPGGTREALFSDNTYQILWHNRVGFAQVALNAKVPIIPIFTQNVREGCRVFGNIGLTRKLYERTRFPSVVPFGGFPVKWRTYVGDPIPYDPNITAAELAEKVKISMQSLINTHQKVPGSIRRALLERFDKNMKQD